MPIVVYNPTTPGRRTMTVLREPSLHKGKPRSPC